jgi:hypothetical protein
MQTPPKEIAMKLLAVKFALLAAVLLAWTALPPFAAADPLIRLSGQGTFVVNDDGITVIHLAGTGNTLGKFVCYGEVLFVPGEEDGSFDGAGPVAFTAANGDQLVGVVAWEINADGTGEAAFHWRDALTFSDGSTVASTGRFANRRPPGAVTSTVAEGTVATRSAKGTIELSDH